MSNGQGGGKRPPTDDRTLLDPLSNDELKALREARQRMQAKKQGTGGAVAHQIVIGPETGEDIGDAPTRAMPALPSFEGNVTLDQISAPPNSRVSGNARDPASVPPEAVVAPTEPMGPEGLSDTVISSPTPSGYKAQGSSSGPTAARAAPITPRPDAAPPRPGQPTGFGENTLLWMQPPKNPAVSAVSTHDLMPKASRVEVAKRRLAKTAITGMFLLVIGSLLFVTLTKKERGVIKLHTTPDKASVRVNGRLFEEKTPVKLTLLEGEHAIELTLEGYEPHRFSTVVEPGSDGGPMNIDLSPISRPGLLTVGIEVQPVSAQIVVDGVVYSGKRTLKIANLDPNAPHKIMIEAGGYVKIEQEIPPGQLSASYSFVLQRDQDP